MRDLAPLALVWDPQCHVSAARRNLLGRAWTPNTKVVGLVVRSVETYSLVESMLAKEDAMRVYVEVARLLLIQDAFADESRSPCNVLNAKTSRKVNWRARLGLDHSIAEPSVEDLMIVEIRITSARAHATFRMLLQHIVRIHRMLSLIAPAARHQFQYYFLSLDQTVPHQSHIAKSNAKRRYLAVIFANRCVTMENADLAFRKLISPAAVDEPLLDQSVTKVLKSLPAVPELTGRLSTVEDMSVASVAARVRRRPMSDKLPNASVATSPWTKTLKPNISA